MSGKYSIELVFTCINSHRLHTFEVREGLPCSLRSRLVLEVESMQFGRHVYLQTLSVDQSGTFGDIATKKTRHDQNQLTLITLYFGLCSQEVPYHLDCNIYGLQQKKTWLMCIFKCVFESPIMKRILNRFKVSY